MSENLNLLAGYVTKAELAAEWQCNERTVDNYRRMPDGLPSLTIGGKVYLPIEGVRDFMARRIRRPNQTRRALRQAAE
jgi:hypothetical protein